MLVLTSQWPSDFRHAIMVTDQGRLFRLFIVKFSSFKFLQSAAVERENENEDTKEEAFSDESDFNQCLYYLQKLSCVLRWSSDATWATLANHTVSADQSHQSLYLISMFSIITFRLNLTLTSWSRRRDRSPRILHTHMLASHRWKL